MNECEKVELHFIDIALGVVITTFLVVSYIPQMFKIIKSKNSHGISPFAQMFSFMSQTLTLSNIFLLQQAILKCCILGKFTIGYCSGSLIGLIQVLIQWLCITIIFIIFIKYFPSNIHPEYHIINEDGEDILKEWRTIVRIVYCVALFLTTIIGLYMVALFCDWDHDSIVYLAGIFGLISSILSSIQFLPQIYKTFISKSVGALSIPTMSIQCPGSFVLVIFLALQPGTNWTTWITYFCGGTFQGILLILCIFYNIKNKRNGTTDSSASESSEAASIEEGKTN